MAARSPVLDNTTTRPRAQAIRVVSGQLFWPLDARETEIQLEDIAHALSHLCRFTGHTRGFYSVAQHSVLVSRLCPVAVALQALLHDASEAYLGDVSRPIKHSGLFDAYRATEARLQALIYRRFGVAETDAPEVKAADTRALHIELRDLVIGSDPTHAVKAGVYPILVVQRPELARHLFLERFHQIVNAPRQERA
jgi:hypothetical protein